jgi:hypothetical protein
MSPQEMNIEKQRAELQQKEKELKQKMREASTQQSFQSQQSFQPQQSYQSQQSQKSVPNFINQPTIPPPSYTGQKSISEINVPDNVRAILNRIKTSTTLAGTSDTQDSVSNNERLLSVENVSDTRKMKKKLPSISINT